MTTRQKVRLLGLSTPFLTIPTLLMVVGLLGLWAILTATEAAVPPTVTDTHLAESAARLEPGAFALFEAKLPDGVDRFSQLLRGSHPDGRGAPPIDTWTDSGYWDPQRQRAFFQGLRQSNRFLTYDAASHAWEEISLDVPNAPPLFERFGHLYGRTALDWKRGHFYRLVGNTLHRYAIDEQRWEKFENSPLGGYISIDWHYGLDLLVGLGNRQLHGFRDGRWTPLGEAAVHGYHSSAKYNPVRDEMLFIGGNHSRNTVDLLDAGGAIHHMKDAPFNFGISQDNLTHDPVSGHYLVLHRDRLLWEYNPDLDEWRIARDFSDAGWPFGRHGGIVPFPIDELGVILWNHGSRAQLYRHRSVFSENPVDSAPPVTKPAAPMVPLETEPVPVAGDPLTATLPTAHLIETEARTMQPGEWRNIAHLTTWPGKENGVSFKGFQTVSGIDGAKGSADGMGWTQNLVYHRGALMMLLMRDGFERALMVMEADGRFWRINQPEGFNQTSHRRPFNKLTQDDTYLYYSPNIGRANLGQMIRTPLDDPGVFESYGIPIGDSQIQGQFAATYAPDWGRFYAYTPGGKIWSWREGEPAWTRHAEMPRDENGQRLSGYAGLLLWNPVRKELAIAGGQVFGSTPSSSHKVYRLTEPLGAPEMLEDRRYPDGALMPWGSGSSKMIVDPRDGSYLVYRNGVLYHNDSAGGTFQVYEDLSESKPFGSWEPYAPLANVPGTDVIVFISHIRGVVLHRLRPLPEGAVSTPAKPATASVPRPVAPRAPAPESLPQTDKSTIETPPSPAPSEDPTLSSEPAPQRAERAAELTSAAIHVLRAARSQPPAMPAPAAVQTPPPPPAEAAADLTSAAIRAIRAARGD